MKKNLFWIFIILLIVFRYFSSRPIYHYGDRVRITGRVVSEPQRYPNYQNVYLAGLRVNLPAFPEINYKDYIVVEGVIKKNKYGDFILANSDLISLRKNKEVLINLRQKIVGFYKRSLPEPHASFITGVTLGVKSALPAAFWEDLKNTGTAHVVVASGFNVTLVGGAVLGVLINFIKRKRAVVLAIVIIWIYAFITGFEAPIVRAVIMGSLAFGAYGFGRLNMVWRALFLSVGVMLLVRPDWIDDLSFWLSFGATTSLMFFGTRLKNLTEKLKVPRWLMEVIGDNFLTSLAAQIGVIPILYVTFGYINIFSPLINALVLWTIAPVTVISMLAGIISLIWPKLAELILYLVYPMTWWFIKVVERFG